MKLKTKPSLENGLAGRFPDTRYMGSKRKLLPAISEVIDSLEVETALDAFSGSGCVAYMMKQKGLQVTTNDFLKFTYQIAHATIENNKQKLSPSDIELLITPNDEREKFIEDTFRGLYFSDEENRFLDSLWINLRRLKSPHKKSLALAAAHRACLKKRARGIFTYTGLRYDDGRADLKKSLTEHFIQAASNWNEAVFDNGQENKSFNNDIFELEAGRHDFVYIDPPYLSDMSDNEYTRRYHFVEGLASYWQEAEIQHHTKTKKIKKKETPFGSKRTVYQGFDRLFEKFSKSILVVSYSSTGIPNREELIGLLKKYKRNVDVLEYDHTYSFSTHGHKVGNSNNHVLEYLFIGS